MKKTMLWVLVFIFSSSLFQGNGYAAIYSKIEGTILDMEAGILLKDVEVTLYDMDSPEGYYARLKTKTDENGYFKFNGLESSGYFVTCKKPGYATYSPAYRAFSNFGGEKLRINLNWGESRYLKIKMVKGGQLKVKVFKKDENGISPYTGFIAQIGLKEGDNTFGVERVASRYRTRNGDFYLDGLIPSNKYRIRIHACERIGYPIFKKEFEVKKNEITTIEHTFDFTDNTGITGMIYLDNVPVKRAILSVDGIDCEESAESWARSGKYSFKNLKPGQYRLEVYFNNDGKEYDIYKKVNIEKNVLKYFDIQIKKR